jgi:thiamine-monophosphate kinase
VPACFRVIGRVVEGAGLLVDGRPFEARGWDPFSGWDGEAG